MIALKKWLRLAVCSAVLASFLWAGSSAYAASSSVYINGHLQDNVITVQGHTMVNVRALTDPAWIVFAYDPKTRVVTVHTKDNRVFVQLREGEKTATVNGKPVKLDAPVVSKDGLTYVPLRFLTETLGAYIRYNPEDNRVIVRTPTGQAQYETLMRGDLTEARRIAIQLARVYGDAPSPKPGEGYHRHNYIFPEGEALRFIFDDSGYCIQYFEVNDEGLAILKWQYDTVADREWGTKPDFDKQVYFMNQFMASLFTYGTVDADGGYNEQGRIYLDNPKDDVLPIDGEKRTDAKP